MCGQTPKVEKVKKSARSSIVGTVVSRSLCSDTTLVRWPNGKEERIKTSKLVTVAA